MGLKTRIRIKNKIRIRTFFRNGGLGEILFLEKTNNRRIVWKSTRKANNFRKNKSMYYDRLSDLGIKLTRRSGQDKVLCPQCSNARKNKRDRCLSVNVTTGEYRCHNCSWQGNVRHFEKRRETKIYDKPDQSIIKNIELKEKIIEWFAERKISEPTLNKFLIFGREEWMPQENKKMNCICFPYLRGDELINVKYRDAKKNFRMTKDAELIFYNLNSINEKKRCILVEGEIDALSAYEVGYGKDCDKDTGEVDLKCEYGVVSVPNGASGSGNSNLDYLDNCADWFLGLDEVVIATDGDPAGRNLCSELVRRLGIERCRILNYPAECVIVDKENKLRPCKDLNEVLINFGKEKVIECIEKAASIPVDGIYFVEDVLDSMVASFKRGVVLGESTHFENFDKYFRWKKGDVNLCTGFGNAGKALCVDTDIPTPGGFKKMGELVDGDSVFDEQGNVCSVIKAHPVMMDRNCFKVTFSDKSEIVCDEDHLWLTHTQASKMSARNKKINGSVLKKHGNNQEHKRILPKVRTTKEILETLFSRRDKKESNHSVDICKPINLPEQNLLIHPYCLGAWLGDGTSAHGSIACNDSEILDLFNFYGYPTIKRKAKFMYGIGNDFFSKIKTLGVLSNKHIPRVYLRSSISQRLDLLKGLMDTDGCIGKNAVCEFTSTKKELADGVYELLMSLGMKATMTIGDAKLYGRITSKKYRIIFKPNIPVFNLSRKNARHTNVRKSDYRQIVSIEKIKSVPVRCITVDSPNSLYLCGRSFIPTHNTYWYLQLMLTKSIYDGWKWGVFSPENYPANDFYDDLIEMYCGKWINDMTEDEYREAAKFVGEHIFYVYPDNEHDLVTIHEKFRYLILKKGIDGVLIDPWNQLDHNQNKFQREDQYLSECFKDIKRFALMNHVSYSIIAHPKNPTYNADRSLPIADMYDLSGGSMWANKMDNIMSYHRPNYHTNKNSPEAQVWVQKIKRKRTGGEPGNIDLRLDWKKKRFMEMPEGTMPCDPGLIKMLGEQGVKVFNQGWLPYADGGKNEIGF